MNAKLLFVVVVVVVVVVGTTLDLKCEISFTNHFWTSATFYGD
jgi:hypothetical protein